jgi:hypothetical protein
MQATTNKRKKRRSKRKKRRSPNKRAIVTPPELALEFGVAAAKVHDWIRSGALRAVNLASDAAKKRQRLGIPRDAIEEFLHSRSTVPMPQPPRTRRRTDETITPYF